MTYEETLIYVMSTARGRQFVWELLSRASVFSTTFNADPYAHAYQAGRRDQALPLYEECERLCPELMAIARKEAHGRLNDAADDAADGRPVVHKPRAEGGNPSGSGADPSGRGGDYDPYGARQVEDAIGAPGQND